MQFRPTLYCSLSGANPFDIMKMTLKTVSRWITSGKGENMKSFATIKETELVFPTYKVYPPEKSPLFIEKRAYQGSTGKVYPFPVTEKISDEKEDVAYKAVVLENEYLEVTVLPELGGRIHRALDKTNNYDFVYFNHVVKPALVGLAGPWISGGIEFNWPQHHRPSTFSPVDYKCTEYADGAVSVYVGEIDKMYGTKGMAEIRLYPGKAYIEIKGQLYNHTEFPQTFLWWANPAVSVNDHTYSVFPPDVNAVMDHGKRAVSTFPIATGEYYKQDYSAGVDISRYKNIKVPTSYMAAHSDFDFIGNYDESREAGLLHVADHHISPGKKQWTWGNGDFGRTWDKNLTDEDGPYIELMTGVFTDNQPDFTWLKAHEEKTFSQYFMPYKGIGRVSNATREAALSFVETVKGKAMLKVYSTSERKAHITVTDHVTGDVVFDAEEVLSPVKHSEFIVNLKSDFDNHTVVISDDGGILLTYKVYIPELKPVPSPASPMDVPERIKSTEELWLCGMHLEQYRHATREPLDYYEEGLRRDPYDIRINNSTGLLKLRRGLFDDAIMHFKRAIKRQTQMNPNPYYGESFFNLGLALLEKGENDKAYDAFYKATWSAETQGPAFYKLSCISCGKGDYAAAVQFADKALIKNAHDVKALLVKIASMRHLKLDVADLLENALSFDPLYMGFYSEKAFALSQESDKDATLLKEMMHGDYNNIIETVSDYMDAGLFKDALTLIYICRDACKIHPLVEYYRAYCAIRLGLTEDCAEAINLAENVSEEMVFPNKLSDIKVLEFAMEKNPKGCMAYYYLGNLFYDRKQYEKAAELWKKAAEINPSMAMCFRNLAIYSFNKMHDSKTALEQMKRAVELDSSYPRFLLELDQLMKKAGVSDCERLDVLSTKIEVVSQRDDLFLRYINLLNGFERFDEALKLLQNRTFHPWEGGEGKVIAEYKKALIGLAKKEIEAGDCDKAIAHLNMTLEYPDNLGEGKLPNVNDNETCYFLGKACEKSGDMTKAREFYERATEGDLTPAQVLYYNDQPSDYIYFIGLAHLALSDTVSAKGAFNQLIAYGNRHLFDTVEYDYFAVSLPEIEVFEEDINKNNKDYCLFLKKLGEEGIVLCGV